MENPNTVRISKSVQKYGRSLIWRLFDNVDIFRLHFEVLPFKTLLQFFHFLTRYLSVFKVQPLSPVAELGLNMSLCILCLYTEHTRHN